MELNNFSRAEADTEKTWPSGPEGRFELANEKTSEVKIHLQRAQ